MDVPTQPAAATHQALRDNVAFWRQQSGQLERDRSNLRYLLPIGAAVAALVFALSRHLLASLAVAGLAITAWALGLYMTSVRREEYAFAQAAAEAELAQAVADVSTPKPQTTPPHPG